MNTKAQTQLSLFAPRWTAEGLEAWLTARSGRLVRLVFTRNRASMVSMRLDHLGVVRLRVDRSFGQAPETVLDALGRYLRTRHAADWRIVSRFAGSLTPAPRPPASHQLLTRGRVHDLAVIRDRVNHEFFQGRLTCRIGWGVRGRRRRRARTRSIRYGSYVKSQNLVRINPLLDDPRVPIDFVTYIVFHEMLHAVVPSESGVRRRHHHVVYRRLEQLLTRTPRYDVILQNGLLQEVAIVRR